MRKLAALSIALLLSVALAGPVMAGDQEAVTKESVTLEGKLKCARCTLKEAGLEKCQNVLIVQKAGQESQYWLAKNATYEKFGDVCMKSTVVRVTGQVEEKDGRLWLAASEIVPVEVEKEG